MPYNPQVPPLDSAGRMTPQFASYLRQIETMDPVYKAADLATLKAVAGARVYVTDTGKPAWFNGTIWRYADGTPT